MHSDKGLLWLSFSVFKGMFEVAPVYHTDLKHALQHFLKILFGCICTPISFFKIYI